MKKGKGFAFKALLLMSVLSSMTFATTTSTTTVPGVNKFVEILTGLATGKVGLFLIVVIMGFSVYNAWKNSNIAALLWGLFASIVIGVLVPYASAISEWAGTVDLTAP